MALSGHMRNKYEDDYVIKKWITILIVVLVVVFLFFILLMGHGKLIKSDTINSINDNVTLIISFIGIIATFIVVGNFSQTNAIREDLREKIHGFKLENDDFKREITLKIEEQEESINTIITSINQETINNTENIKKTFADIEVLKDKKDYSQQLLTLIIKLSTNKDLANLVNKLYPFKDTYKVHIISEASRRTHTVYIRFENGDTKFLDSADQIELNNVNTINSIPYKNEYGKYLALIENIRKNLSTNDPIFMKESNTIEQQDLHGEENDIQQDNVDL